MDNSKIAHDIAVSLLLEALKQNNTEFYLFDNPDSGTFNSKEVVGIYRDMYNALLKELNSHQ